MNSNKSSEAFVMCKIFMYVKVICRTLYVNQVLIRYATRVRNLLTYITELSAHGVSLRIRASHLTLHAMLVAGAHHLQSLY